MITKLPVQQMFADTNIYINIISLINWDSLASDRITFNFILVHSILINVSSGKLWSIEKSLK